MHLEKMLGFTPLEAGSEHIFTRREIAQAKTSYLANSFFLFLYFKLIEGETEKKNLVQPNLST